MYYFWTQFCIQFQFLKKLKHIIFTELHCVKSVQIRSYFWSVFSCIQSEYRKILTRNNSVFGHFSRNVWVKNSSTSNFIQQQQQPQKPQKISLKHASQVAEEFSLPKKDLLPPNRQQIWPKDNCQYQFGVGKFRLFVFILLNTKNDNYPKNDSRYFSFQIN